MLNSAGAALANAAQGTFTYGASSHLHAVSSVGTGSTGYSAAYGAAGNLTCRAPGASTCTNATPTGQALGYDALRRLISWQDATTTPTATGAYAYDGSGTRVWQQDTSTSGGVTTTTTITYILGFAEITSVQTGQATPSTTATRFYPLSGGVSALRDAAGLSYVASDQLGTPIATLNLDTGAVLGEQLRAPYGQARYAANAPTNGGMRTTYGFTGQREDASAAGSSGLDYFNARYYDPTSGRFTSPDSLMGSDPLLDGYAYVGGRVESATDPSGHRPTTCDSDECGGGATEGGSDVGGGSGGGGTGGGDGGSGDGGSGDGGSGDGGSGDGGSGDGGSGDSAVSSGQIGQIGTVADNPVPEVGGRFDPDGQAWERGLGAEGDAAPETNGRFTADEQDRPTEPNKPTETNTTNAPDTQTTDNGSDANGGNGDGGSPPGGNGPGAPPPPPPATSTELADGAQQAADALPSVYDGAQVDVPADTYNWEFQPERTVMDDSYNPAFGSYTMRYYLTRCASFES